MTKLLCMAGSIRKESMNKKLAQLAAKMAKKDGIEKTFIDLKDYEMPLYNGNLEDKNGLPENAIKLKQLFIENDGIFIASPEYNGSFSALLKNTLDWISRSHSENEPSLSAYKGKVAAISAVSPRPIGGLRGLVPLRMLLGNLGVTVTPTQVAIGSGFKAFDSEGKLVDERQTSKLQATVDELIKTTQALNTY